MLLMDLCRSGHVRNPRATPRLPRQVYGLPTLIVFKEGQELANSKREGAITKALLEQYLTKNGITK